MPWRKYSGTSILSEGPRDWQNLFAIPWLRYIEVHFHIIYFTITEVKKVVRYTEDLYRGSLNRGSTVEGNSVLWTCKIQGAQHMICMKKLQCSSRPWAKVGRQGHQALIENSPACYKWSIGVWSDCVLYIPLILSGRPNECWLPTCPQYAIATCRIAGSSGRPQ